MWLNVKIMSLWIISECAPTVHPAECSLSLGAAHFWFSNMSGRGRAPGSYVVPMEHGDLWVYFILTSDLGKDISGRYKMTPQHEVYQKDLWNSDIAPASSWSSHASHWFDFIFEFWLAGTRGLRKTCGENCFFLENKGLSSSLTCHAA